MVKVEEQQMVKGEDYFRRVAVEKEAIFHRFGDGTAYADDAKVPFTVAIVEMKETGEVKSVAPDLVRFTGH